jgi:hypothetical protein
MRIKAGIIAALVAGIVWLPAVGAAASLEPLGAPVGQALLSSGSLAGMEGAPDTSGQAPANLTVANDPWNQGY